MIYLEQPGPLTASNGLNLHCQIWPAPTHSLGVLVLVHGLGEHLGCYEHVAAHLNQAGITVAGFDLPGHGRSDGARGHVNDWQDYQQSLAQFMPWIQAHFPRVPLFLMGQSLGAMIVLDFAMQPESMQPESMQPESMQPESMQPKPMQPKHQVQGIVVSGAPIVPTGGNHPLKVLAAQVLSAPFPRWPLKTGIDTTALSRDPQLIERRQQDPLIHHVATLRWGAEMLKAIARIKANPTKVSQPLLMIHGSCDRISAVSGAKAFFEAVPHANKTLKIYPGNYHEPHNDLDAAQVLDDLQDWIHTQTSKIQQTH